MMKSRSLSKKLTSTFTPNKPAEESGKNDIDSSPAQRDIKRKSSQGSEGCGSNDTMSVKKEDAWPECPSPLTPNLEEPSETAPKDTKGTSGGSFTNLAVSQRPYQFPSQDTETTSKAGSESGEVTARLKDFIARNSEYVEVINTYIQEVMHVPYEDNVQNDIAVGKWLCELVPKLKKDLIPLMPEARKYKIDMSTIDVYANLRIEIEKRYSLVARILVFIGITAGIFRGR
jgi:hypothetical protein